MKTLQQVNSISFPKEAPCIICGRNPGTTVINLGEVDLRNFSSFNNRNAHVSLVGVPCCSSCNARHDSFRRGLKIWTYVSALPTIIAGILTALALRDGPVFLILFLVVLGCPCIWLLFVAPALFIEKILFHRKAKQWLKKFATIDP